MRASLRYCAVRLVSCMINDEQPLELLSDMRINFQSYSNNPAVTFAVVSLLIELDIELTGTKVENGYRCRRPVRKKVIRKRGMLYYCVI